MSGVHEVFHVSMLWMYTLDPAHVVDWGEIEVDTDETFEEGPMCIMDSRDQVLRRKTVRLVRVLWLVTPGSRSDPKGESEPSPGHETIIWDSLPLFFFFFKAEIIPVGIKTIFVITKNHLHIQKNYHRSGVHQNLYTYTKSHLLIQTLIHIYV